MFSPSPITTNNPAIAGKQQIARIARRIIARNYGLIDRILNIVVESNGLIKIWFQDDNLERSVILMTIGDTVEYQDITNRRTDSITKNIDWYIVSYANNIQLREDAIRKPKNCKKGTPCKGECIPKGSICRDIPVAKDEAIAINEAVAKSAPQKVVTEPANEDPYRDLNIRQLKEVAREKGVMRYSYMTQDQLKDAIRVYDANPDYRENIRKGLQRQKDEATLKKVKTTEIGRALSTIDPKLGRQYNLIKAISKKNEKNPTEARIYALASLLSTSVLVAKTLAKRRAGNINEAKVDAISSASDIRESIPEVKEPSVTFVVGSYSKGSNDLANNLKNSKNISDEDKLWLENETKLIPFKRSKEGTTPPSDPLRAFGENFATGYKFAIGNNINNGKGKEAIALASQLYVYGSKYSLDRDGLLSSPALNVLAGEDGGIVARDAIEILRKMPKSPDSNGIRGTDIADRVRLVTLGTPYFGLAKPDVPEANIMGSDDLWNLTPFTKGGNETRKVSGVGSSGQSSYIESSDAMNIAFRHLRTVQEDRRKINPESIKARDAAIREQENLAKSEAERTEEEKRRIAREQKKAADVKVVADRVKLEVEAIAKAQGKTFTQFVTENPDLFADITAKTKKKIAEEKAKQRAAEEVKKAINNDSAIYLLARSDAYKKLKCKAGYIQRGAACQKIKTDQNIPERSLRGNIVKGLGNAAKTVGTGVAAGAGIMTFAIAASAIAHIASRGEIQTEGLNTISNNDLKDYTNAGIPTAEGFTGRVEFVKSPNGEVFAKKESKGTIGYIAYQASKEALVADIAANSGIPHVKVQLITDIDKPASLQSMARGGEVEKLINNGSLPKINLQQIERGKDGFYPKFTTENLDAIAQNPDLARIAALDTFIGNADRHSGNLFYDAKTNRYTAIDSAMSFDFNLSRPARDYFERLDFSSLNEQQKKGIEIYSETLNNLVSQNPPKKVKAGVYGYAAKSGENPLINTFREMNSRQKIDESYQDSLALAKILKDKLSARSDSFRTSTYLLARSDAYKKLKCKAGYIQRGAACQKQKNEPMPRISTPRYTNSEILRYGLPIASVAAIALAGKTVADDVKKVTGRIEPDDIVLKEGEPVPQEVLDMYEKNFVPGDLIKKKSILNGMTIEHYGIYAGQGKIIETYAKGKFGGSTLTKEDIGRPSESDGTAYQKVEDISKEAKPLSKEKALELAESMIGIPIKFDGVETNCEAIARAITQGDARTSQGEKLSWLTKSIGKAAVAVASPIKNLDKGFTASEVQDLLIKNNYDPTLVKAVFADSVARRKQDIERANRGDSMEITALRSPDEFAVIVDKTIAPLNGASKTLVEQGMYKAYLVATIALVSKKPKGNASK